jgi:3-hydroxyisobutyrate dehydrogenase
VESIGIIGIGRMGSPVSARLAEAGFPLVGTDANHGRRDAVESFGGRWADSPEEVADACDVLVTVLPGSPELRAVMTPLLRKLDRELTWIDLTSASPRVAAELRALRADVACIDAPMGGGPTEARSGGLALFVGGASETVELHRRLLETLGTIHHVGGPGAGHVVKLLVNLLWFGQALATGEALLLAKRSGLALETVRDALASSAADSRFIRDDLDALLTGDYRADFGLDRCYEELVAITELADELSVPFELSDLVRDMHGRALEHFGPRDGELLGVAMLEEVAGETIRSSR